jgi:hypothetical protein
MADIHLERKHAMGLKKARAAALLVAADRVCLDARLGLLLSPMRPRIEAQVNENFARYFA